MLRESHFNARSEGGGQDAKFAPESFESQQQLSASHQLTLSQDGGLSAPLHSGFVSPNISADPYAGATAGNGKVIWTPEEAAENLDRYGCDFMHGNYGVPNHGVLTYGFWTPEQFYNSYFFDLRYSDGSAF